MKKIIKRFLTTIYIIAALGIGFAALVFYGPLEGLRALYVTSAETSMNHRWMATAFISQNEINRIMDSNKTIQADENTDINKIAGACIEGQPQDLDGIQLVNVANGKYKGYMLIVNNPARVSVASAKQPGKSGMTVQDIVKAYGAIGGVNAGGFSDKNGNGTGDIPEGILIENGKILYKDSMDYYPVIGFNKHNVLVLGRFTLRQIEYIGIRDAVTFKPFLIVNGVPSITRGNGGWGIAPRTAIGQTKDGRILLLVIDGREVSSIGASMKDVIDIMLKFGAYNAANLDGGASSTMVYQGRTVNHPYSSNGSRKVASCFIIK